MAFGWDINAIATTGLRIMVIVIVALVGIVVIHNLTLQKLSEEARRRFLDSVSPVVVAVGTEEESDLREKVKRVIGIDLFKGG